MRNFRSSNPGEHWTLKLWCNLLLLSRDVRARLKSRVYNTLQLWEIRVRRRLQVSDQVPFGAERCFVIFWNHSRSLNWSVHVPSSSHYSLGNPGDQGIRCRMDNNRGLEPTYLIILDDTLVFIPCWPEFLENLCVLLWSAGHSVQNSVIPRLLWHWRPPIEGESHVPFCAELHKRAHLSIFLF
jgi:hypothetical protein